LGRHVVAHTINGTLCGAAALGNLVAKGVESRLYIVAQIADCIVNTVETVGDGVIQRIGRIRKTIGLLIQLDIRVC
jgi:hypothetical protein